MQEESITVVYIWSLVAKMVFAVLETISGILLYQMGSTYITHVLTQFTQERLTHDPSDIIATTLTHWGSHITAGGTTFAGLYLVTHGVVKLVLVCALLRRYTWSYPAAIGVFGMFIVYQLYRYTHTASTWLLVLTVFDCIIIYLIYHEWQLVRAQPQIQ